MLKPDLPMIQDEEGASVPKGFPFNAGAVMFVDLFYPFFLAALLILYHQGKKAEQGTLS